MDILGVLGGIGGILGLLVLWGAMASDRKSVDKNAYELVLASRIDEVGVEMQRLMFARILQEGHQDADEREYNLSRFRQHKVKEVLSELTAEQFEYLLTTVRKQNQNH